MYEALKKCKTDSEAVIDISLQYFSKEATGDKAAAIKQFVLSFGTDEDA